MKKERRKILKGEGEGEREKEIEKEGEREYRVISEQKVRKRM